VALSRAAAPSTATNTLRAEIEVVEGMLEERGQLLTYRDVNVLAKPRCAGSIDRVSAVLRLRSILSFVALDFWTPDWPGV
jgi:hypothetical protein